MAINRYMRTVLRALSYPDIDLKQHYLLARTATKITHPPMPKVDYCTVPLLVRNQDYYVPCRLFTPGKKQKVTEKMIIFAHGGGWIAGDVHTYSRVCQTMADQTQQMVLSVDYRLAPEWKYPIPLQDYYAVVQEMFLRPILPVKPENITLMGDSAGGNLTAAVSLLARDKGDFLPKRQILIYPACAGDHNPETAPYPSLRENGEGYLLTTNHVCDYMALYASAPENQTDPYFAPLSAKTLINQPDTLLITAQYDPLRDEGEAYGARLLADGNRVVMRRMPDALHGFFSLSIRFQQVKSCYSHINDFLREETQ